MIKIVDIIKVLEAWAPPALQESYDNVGLLTGDRSDRCTGVLCCLDVTEQVIDEALQKGCNLVVAHHPLIFRGIKKLSGGTGVERALIKAIKNELAIYAIHTNLDNVLSGVNGKIASLLSLQRSRVLLPKETTLRKLVTYVPLQHTEPVRQALFDAGAGQIGNYSECSFSVAGEGTFMPGAAARPFVGANGQRHQEKENRLEVLFPVYLQGALLEALHKAHPYEEVAYELLPLDNANHTLGAGLVGELAEPVEEAVFLTQLAHRFGARPVRHSPLLGRPIRRVALCGGAGSFLIPNALSAGADIFITADLKYHDFFLADGRMILADIGHFESEQFTIELLADNLAEKFHNFAVLKTSINTNPVNYLWHK
ncbi:MAG: Nif3-like dinuclear metal center hexameric protein [Sphingomonadales bacterium]|nr:Nif3-like dinuclear metal center hexameric protein [Sphingomonadales bacterium]